MRSFFGVTQYPKKEEEERLTVQVSLSKSAPDNPGA
jgi:hypothetical protein